MEHVFRQAFVVKGLSIPSWFAQLRHEKADIVGIQELRMRRYTYGQ